ncbi:MAG: hypothetical protein J1E81_05110 [Eubacterium sp.]|nr:hypothetical protein [Eubacterium sp.]
MKLIKKQDNNGNDYYEEILETKEEINESINNSIKKRKKKRTKKIITMIISIVICIISGLALFNKITLDFLGDYQIIISFFTFFIGFTGFEESARKLK